MCIWECEFCGYKNEIIIEAEEIPESSSVEYFIESKNKKNLVETKYNQGQIIFVFDTSGSMCVTEAVQGKHILKTSSSLQSKNNDIFNEFGKDTNLLAQNYGNSKSNVTYISRLQCLQSAIEDNLENLKKQIPNVKIGFVQFNNESYSNRRWNET